MATKNNTDAFDDTSMIGMEVINKSLTIREICKGYVDNSIKDEGGVSSMDGRLNIRPRYQRTYIVDDNKVWKEKLINSIICGYPINRIYIGVDVEEKAKGKSFIEWALEMLDGQQRTITICNFINGVFPIEINGKPYFWSNLDDKYRDRIMNYQLDATYCIGDEEARIKWFKRINQPNSLLTNQELRNSTYLGEFLEDAKRFFCATSKHAQKQINDKTDKYCITRYTSATAIDRCEFLEVALDWASYIAYEDLRGDEDMDKRICRYMAQHQKDDNAKELITTYKTVVDWIVDTYWKNQEDYPAFDEFQKVEWARLFCEYGCNEYTEDEKKEFTEKCLDIIESRYDISSPKGVFEWVIRGAKEDEANEFLKPRRFKTRDLDNMYMQQGGIDPIDNKYYPRDNMAAHHIRPWMDKGTSTFDNLVWLSKENHNKLHAGAISLSGVELKNRLNELRKANGYF